jgi:hypothetical protein
MSYSISTELVQWLTNSQKSLRSSVLFRVYENLLFLFLVNKQQAIYISIKEYSQQIGLSRHTLGSYMSILKKQGWIAYHESYNRTMIVYWVRLSERDAAPKTVEPGVKIKSPNGKVYFVRLGQFREFEKKHGLPDRTIQYLKRRFEDDRDTTDRIQWKLLDIVEWEPKKVSK